jgi:hypothetical protein
LVSLIIPPTPWNSCTDIDEKDGMFIVPSRASGMLTASLMHTMHILDMINAIPGDLGQEPAISLQRLNALGIHCHSGGFADVFSRVCRHGVDVVVGSSQG